jgi:hypothetical protein
MTGLSDHRALSVHVTSPRSVNIGPGLWRMPCSLPGVEEYRLAQTPMIKDFVTAAASIPDADLAGAYVTFKEKVRVFSTAFSQDLNRVRRARQAQLQEIVESSLQHMTQEPEGQSRSFWSEVAAQAEAFLVDGVAVEVHEATERAGLEARDLGDKPTAWFHDMGRNPWRPEAIPLPLPGRTIAGNVI